MVNFDDYVNKNKTEHNKNWPYTPNYPYRILIIGGSGSGKTNVLLKLIENQPDIDNIYLYPKDPYDAKYQYLINKRESVGIIILRILKLLLSIQMTCAIFAKLLMITILIKKNKILIVFDDMIVDMIHNKKLDSVVTKLFIRGRKLNIYLVFIT